MAVQTQRPGHATVRFATTLNRAAVPRRAPSLVGVGAQGLATGLVAGTLIASGGDAATVAALMAQAVRFLAVIAGVTGG